MAQAGRHGRTRTARGDGHRDQEHRPVSRHADRGAEVGGVQDPRAHAAGPAGTDAERRAEEQVGAGALGHPVDHDHGGRAPAPGVA